MSEKKIFKSDVNPYRASIYEHTDRIFTCDSFKEDAESCYQFLEKHDEIYIEIGSGSGGHLLDQAERKPEAFFLGFEIRFKRAVRTVEKAKARKIDNVYIARINAINLLKMVPENSVDGIYLNFPDPWSKEKQKKNRIFSDEYLDEIKKVLKKSAFFSFKTDHSEYFHYVKDICEKRTDYQLLEASEDLHNSDYANQNIKSEFEMLFLSQSLPINYIKLVKL